MKSQVSVLRDANNLRLLKNWLIHLRSHLSNLLCRHLLLHHQLLLHHLLLLNLRLDYHLRLQCHTRLCGNISYAALNEVRSKMYSASLFAIVSNHDPLLPAARQTHSLNWEFYMADDGLLAALLVSYLNARHLCAVLDLDVKEVRFVPFWIFPSTPADW